MKGTAATAAGPSAPGGDDDDPAGPPPDEGGSDSDHASDDSDGANTDSSSESNRRPRSRSPRRYGAAGCTAAKVEHNLASGASTGSFAFCWNKWFSWVIDIDALRWGASFITPVPPWLDDFDGSVGSACKPRVRDVLIEDCYPAPVCIGPAMCAHGIGIACAIAGAWAVQHLHNIFQLRCVRCEGTDEAASCAQREGLNDRGAPVRGRWQLPGDDQAQCPVPDFTVDRPETAAQHHPPVVRPWQFLLLSPELSREHVELRLVVPCTVQAAVAAIVQVRG